MSSPVSYGAGEEGQLMTLGFIVAHLFKIEVISACDLYMYFRQKISHKHGKQNRGHTK